MQRPFASIVFAYGAGLLLAWLAHPPLAGLFATSAGILLIALCSKKLRPFLVWPLLALLGWANLESRTAVISHNDLRTTLGNQPALVTLRGELAETPRLKIIKIDGEETWRSLARIRVSAIATNENFLPASGEVLAVTSGILDSNFFAGQVVQLSGVIARPTPPLAKGLFDYPDYLATRGIYYQLKTESTDDWILLPPAATKPPCTDRFLNWSKRTLALGLPAEDEPLRLLWAMTLGWRTAFTGDIDEPFLRAGTMHMFAIDGLRIALLSGMIVALLRVLRLGRAWCGAIAIPIIWFYTAATGWEASAIRASVMMTVVLGGWTLKRPGDLLNSLAAAALIILVCEPRQLFEASFQLSFFVMLVIALMLPPLNLFFDRILRLDPLLPVELASRWKTWSLNAGRVTLRYFGLSFAAWLGSLPLAAKYFHLLSPVSTLANVVAVPLGTLALMANLGALICGTWFPWATELFNHAAWGCMVAMTWVSEQATRLPGAYFYVPEPSLLTIGLYYAVLIAAFSGWFKTSRRILGGGVILLVIAGGYLWQWQSSRGETDLTVLPLSGGSVIYVDADGRANDWLINSGTEKAVEMTLKDYLRAQGVNRIRRLVLSEGDIRNCGGASSLDKLFGVDELWTGTTRFRSETYRDTIYAFEKPVNRHKLMNYGDIVGPWQVLFPDTTNTLAKAADKPLVLRGDFAGTKILFLSDLSRPSQSDLLSHTNVDLHADIVIAGIPEEGEPLCNALITAIQPKAIIIADSDMPAQYRASDTMKQRLAQTKIPILYTRTADAVTISMDKNGWKLRSMDGQKFEGQQGHPK
ncbi:MAG TPA: ComEC/Rec2 family competence protein [Candidatus Acidoferrales bacterium]|jgi:competence protein ComEC|nr:ComEC/Rec2 family competence protein [Candidatus Acidoferrales bacterium]